MKRLALFTTTVAFAATLSAAPLALGQQRPATHAQVQNRGMLRSKLNAAKGWLDPTKKGRDNRKDARRIKRLQRLERGPRLNRTQRKRLANPGKPIRNLAKRRR